MSLETHASMTGLLLVMEGWPCARGLALIPGLTQWGEAPDSRAIACDGTAGRWMVPSPKCVPSYRILSMARTSLEARFCPRVQASRVEGLSRVEINRGH